MSNIFKEYLGIEIPIWMQSRKNLLLLFCLDFILFIFIKIDQYKQDLNPKSLIITIILSILWCLISYVNGKYSFYKNNAYLINKVLSLIKSNLISLIFIYLIEKTIIIFFPSIVPFGKNKIFLLGAISFFLQCDLSYIFSYVRGSRIHFRREQGNT